jgi:hypothetical protein
MSRHQHRTVVKRVHPHAWRWRLLALLSTLSVCVAAGIWWGLQIATLPPATDDREAVLNDQLNQLSLQSEADRQTLSELQHHLSEQAADIAALEDMLAFYRGVLAPEDAETPVVLRRPELAYLPDSGGWRVTVVVHRGEGGDKLYRGQLSLEITGQGPVEAALIRADEVDSTMTSGVFPLRFRYLQQVQAVISLPEAFVPETIESVVTLTEPVRRTVRRSDLWQDLADASVSSQP